MIVKPSSHTKKLVKNNINNHNTILDPGQAKVGLVRMRHELWSCEWEETKGRVHSKKKKLRIFLTLVRKERPKFIFSLWWPIRYFLQKKKKIPLKNLKNSTNLVNILNIFQVLVVRGGYPPYEKIFSADLHELEHEKIKIIICSKQFAHLPRKGWFSKVPNL